MVHRQKITSKLLKKWIKDEMEGAEEYLRYGFPEQSRDEQRHAFHFQNLLFEKTHPVK